MYLNMYILSEVLPNMHLIKRAKLKEKHFKIVHVCVCVCALAGEILDILTRQQRKSIHQDAKTVQSFRDFRTQSPRMNGARCSKRSAAPKYY